MAVRTELTFSGKQRSEIGSTEKRHKLAQPQPSDKAVARRTYAAGSSD